ncbi:MAG: putative Transaldolase, partial [Parcubacteria group bacterium GW2011_GWA1_51_12]
MKIFIDTANLADIEDALKRGLIDGITTNPSLLAKEPKAKFEDHIQKIIDLVYKWRGTSPISISVEVFSRDPDEILKQAREFQRRFNYPALSVKIHIGWNELGIIRMLSQQGISVNCTACMTPTQALMAAAAGARYVSLFWGRIRDSGDKSKPTWPAIEKMLSSGDLHIDDLDPAKV